MLAYVCVDAKLQKILDNNQQSNKCIQFSTSNTKDAQKQALEWDRDQWWYSYLSNLFIVSNLERDRERNDYVKNSKKVKLSLSQSTCNRRHVLCRKYVDGFVMGFQLIPQACSQSAFNAWIKLRLSLQLNAIQLA